jgi:enoyl-CoA hydratase/carnithine racemase
LVLTSAVPNIYSGGLDLDVLARDPPISPKDFSAYSHVFQQTWLDLHRLPIPVIAAVNGNAPAAGCILAVACDARVMVRTTSTGKPAAIGVTAARARFAAPPWVGADLGRLVGAAKAEQLLQLGTLVPAEVAASIGLVDRVVDGLGSGLVASGGDAAQALRVWSGAAPADDGEALTSEAIGLALDYMDTSAYAYWLTKATMRSEVLAALPDTRYARGRRDALLRLHHGAEHTHAPRRVSGEFAQTVVGEDSDSTWLTSWSIVHVVWNQAVTLCRPPQVNVF